MKLNQFEQQLERDWAHNLQKKEREAIIAYLRSFELEGPSFKDFSDIYPPEEIDRDKKEMGRLKGEFKENTDDNDPYFYAKILELIMTEFSSSWINGYLAKASEYDDIKRKTDIILEIETDSGSIIRIGLDVTSSEDHAANKISGIIENIRAGKLGQELKYFYSQIDETKGKIRLPRLVIGADRVNIIELARLYIRYRQSINGEERSRIKKQIDEHRFGKELAQELLIQTREFLSKAKQWQNSLSEADKNVIENMEELEAELSKEKEKAPSNVNADEAPNRVLASMAASLTSKAA